eukprot:SM000020S06106  [mRNA]  locus=s20:995237:1001539:- [translate_table: standard]
MSAILIAYTCMTFILTEYTHEPGWRDLPARRLTTSCLVWQSIGTQQAQWRDPLLLSLISLLHARPCNRLCARPVVVTLWPTSLKCGHRACNDEQLLCCTPRQNVAIELAIMSNYSALSLICEAGYDCDLFVAHRDFSYNNLTGFFPISLSESGTIQIINLAGNSFHGIVYAYSGDSKKLRKLLHSFRGSSFLRQSGCGVCSRLQSCTLQVTLVCFPAVRQVHGAIWTNMLTEHLVTPQLEALPTSHVLAARVMWPPGCSGAGQCDYSKYYTAANGTACGPQTGKRCQDQACSLGQCQTAKRYPNSTICDEYNPNALDVRCQVSSCSAGECTNVTSNKPAGTVCLPTPGQYYMPYITGTCETDECCAHCDGAGRCDEDIRDGQSCTKCTGPSCGKGTSGCEPSGCSCARTSCVFNYL